MILLTCTSGVPISWVTLMLGLPYPEAQYGVMADEVSGGGVYSAIHGKMFVFDSDSVVIGFCL